MSRNTRSSRRHYSKSSKRDIPKGQTRISFWDVLLFLILAFVILLIAILVMDLIKQPQAYVTLRTVKAVLRHFREVIVDFFTVRFPALVQKLTSKI